MDDDISFKIKIDPILKRKAQILFESLGLDLNTAINMFLYQAVREQAIPFRICRNVPNHETIKAIEDAEKGIGLSKGFTSVSELMDDLNSDGK